MDLLNKWCIYLLIVLYTRLRCGAGSDGCLKNNDYDYVVVGSGSSGAVVAGRLSEDSDVTVLLLEAGGEPPESSKIPFHAFDTFRTEMDWNYTAPHQKNCCGYFSGQTPPLPRGKTLGGTSAMNFMTYTRGNKQDYDSWEALGNEGWSYEDVLPYFYKIEDYRAPRRRDEDKHHRTGGPITLEYPSFRTPLAQAFLDGGQELGVPLVDYNTDENIGFMYPVVNTKNGVRCSSYVGYLKPHLRRKNLRIETRSLATKILFSDQKIATGVEYEKNKVKCKVNARREVIVSGGVYNSPQLLMLSGIGPKEHLKKFEIAVVSDLPGVGQNLQDHIACTATTILFNQSIGHNFQRLNTPENLEIWRKSGTGPLATPAAVEGVAYFSTPLNKDDPDWPDMEIYMINDNIRRIVYPLVTNLVALGWPSEETDLTLLIGILLRPKSRGKITLQSTDPYDPPFIEPNYLRHPDDLRVLVEGSRFIRKLMHTHAFQKYGASLIANGFVPNCVLNWLNDEEYLKCVTRFFSGSGLHPSSSCKMGPSKDPMAVVDERLRVYGVKRLRVADASIMPNVVAAHPNAACMMIGEKAAAMIKKDWKWIKKP